MNLIISIILLGAVNLGMCDPADDPVYTANCAPPIGLNSTTGTTVGPVGPAYPSILPIERCCPACEECINVGGHCKIRWLPDLYPEWCDFTTIPLCRDYSCTCCIKCSDDKCSDCTQTGGECRTQCRAGEIEDRNNKCSFPSPNSHTDDGEGCKCCKKCEATSECTDALGTCVTDPADCPAGSFASTGCCGGCYCCKPVQEGIPDPQDPTTSSCSNPGAYCSDADDCAVGYYPCFGQCEATQFVNGLTQKVPGYCCEPKSASPAVPNTGKRSVNNFVNQMIGHEVIGAANYGRNRHQF